MKQTVFIISLFVIIFLLGYQLLPTNDYFFTFHDITQPARIEQFTKEIKSFHLPPRVASDMNYKLGYPVFNFYAPFSYWITSFFNFIGFDIISSLKISFFLALTIGFFGSYLFLKRFFDFFPSILGGFFYITTLYFPLNIFVRGNLAETWFLALLPLTMFSLLSNNFIFTSIMLSFLFTSHNILSLISMPFIFIFAFITKNKKKNLVSILFGLLLSTYFWLPAILEMKYTWAKEVATSTNFRDHFLCISQLWQSQWGYGGSTKGCISDGMSFMIGKLQIIFFVFGLFIFFLNKKNRYKKIYWFFILTTFISLFLTVYQSQFIWEIFSPIISFIQFPWRLIAFSIIGISFFSANFFHHIKIPFKSIFLVIVLIGILIINGKYFRGQEIFKKDFENKFLTEEYIEKKAAYAIAEYLPKTINYQYWRSLENKKEIPKDFLSKTSITPFSKEKQTLIEKIGNFISFITIILLIIKTVFEQRLSFKKNHG